MQIAIVQHPPVFLNLEASVGRACELIRDAAFGDADVVVFPETWLPGYPVWLDVSPGAALWDHAPARALFQVFFENALVLGGEPFERIRRAAKESDTHVVMGANERVGGTVYNTMIYLHRDGVAFDLHRKLMPTYSERMLWGRGDGSTLGVLETEHGNIGGLICWEHWMPLARAAMHARQEVLHVAQWPAVKEMNLLASRHYAFEGQCFVAAAGCVLRKREVIDGFRSACGPAAAGGELLEAIPGDADDLVLAGGSAVIAPDGTLIVGPVHGEPCVLRAELHRDLIAQGRLLLDTNGHYGRPDVFHLDVDTTPRRNVTFRS